MNAWKHAVLELRRHLNGKKKKRTLAVFYRGSATTNLNVNNKNNTVFSGGKKIKKKSDACLKLLSRIGGALTSGEELNCRWEGEKEEDYDKRMIKRLSIIAVQARHHFPCSAKKKKKRRITLFWI